MPSDRPHESLPTDAGSVSFQTILTTLANAEVNERGDVAPENGRVIEDPETGAVSIGDGDEWVDAEHDLSLDVAGLPGIEIVRSVDDLPEPESGVHQLDDTAYLFTGEVTSDAGLELGDPSPLIGYHRESSWFIHTGGGTAISTQDTSVIMNQLGINAPGGTIFDIDGTEEDEFLLNSVYLADDQELGTISDLGTIGTFRGPELRVAGIRDFASGLTFNGTYNRIYIESKIRDVIDSGVTVFDFTSDFHATNVDMTDSDVSDVQSDTQVINTDAGATIDEAILYRGNSHDETVTKDNILSGALDFDSVGVDVKSSWPIADTFPSASYSKDGTTITTISAQDPGDGSEAVKITGATTEFTGTTSRFTHTSPNRITYIGKRDYKAVAHATASVSGSNTTVAIYFAKNGSVLQRSAIEIDTASAGQPRTALLTTRIPLVTDDYLEVWVANEGGTGDITVSTLEVTL